MARAVQPHTASSGRSNVYSEPYSILVHSVRPVQLEKGESPDFVLATCGRSVGVEATEAINPDYVRATMYPNARDEDSLVDPVPVQVGSRASRGVADC